MKKENNKKNFAAHEKWMETKRANRPKQHWNDQHNGHFVPVRWPQETLADSDPLMELKIHQYLEGE